MSAYRQFRPNVAAFQNRPHILRVLDQKWKNLKTVHLSSISAKCGRILNPSTFFLFERSCATCPPDLRLDTKSLMVQSSKQRYHATFTGAQQQDISEYLHERKRPRLEIPLPPTTTLPLSYFDLLPSELTVRVIRHLSHRPSSDMWSTTLSNRSLRTLFSKSLPLSEGPIVATEAIYLDYSRIVSETLPEGPMRHERLRWVLRSRVFETMFSECALALRWHRLGCIEISGLTAGLTFCKATWTFFERTAPAVRRLVFRHVSAVAFEPRFVAYDMLALFGARLEHVELDMSAPLRPHVGEAPAPMANLLSVCPQLCSLHCTGIELSYVTLALRQSPAPSRLRTISWKDQWSDPPSEAAWTDFFRAVRDRAPEFQDLRVMPFNRAPSVSCVSKHLDLAQRNLRELCVDAASTCPLDSALAQLCPTELDVIQVQGRLKPSVLRVLRACKAIQVVHLMLVEDPIKVRTNRPAALSTFLYACLRACSLYRPAYYRSAFFPFSNACGPRRKNVPALTQAGSRGP